MIADVSRREKSKALLHALGLALVVVLLAPPVAQAAKVTVVKVKGPVSIRSTDGVEIESKEIGPMGLLQAEGSDGALAVRTFAGGGGFIGAGSCHQDALDSTINASNVIVTGIIMTGTDAKIDVTSAAVGGGTIPLAEFRVNENAPNSFVGLGNGLTLTAPLTFTCTGTNGSFVLLGQ